MKKILLADDEELVRTLVLVTLGRDPRYAVLEATDGQEALDLARAEHPDLLLLDVNMPRLDGVEVCRALKSDDATRLITVIMLTARGRPEDRKSAFDAGADGYFTKPFSPLALLQKVEEVIGA